MGTLPNKWPGTIFDNVGDCRRYRICGRDASREGGTSCSRQGVRRYHNIARCAKGLRAGSAEVQDKAIELVAELGKEYSQSFLEFLRPTVPRLSGSLVPPANNARARSRSPPRARAATKFAVAELCGMRVAKDFSGEIYFGTVVEKIKGAVLAAPNAKGIRLWEAVWKIEYDDGDVEQQNRFEIIALIKNYRRHRQADNRIGLNNAVNIDEVNEDVDEEADSAPEHGILGTSTNFLDPSVQFVGTANSDGDPTSIKLSC